MVTAHFTPAPATSAPSSAPVHGYSDFSYVASSLADADAQAYRSAGILLYDVDRSSSPPVLLSLLLGRNHESRIEFLSGKREVADADVYATAAREFDEESGGVLADCAGDVAHRALLARACRSSKVLWCAHIWRVTIL
jgi:hypothetical protein